MNAVTPSQAKYYAEFIAAEPEAGEYLGKQYDPNLMVGAYAPEEPGYVDPDNSWTTDGVEEIEQVAG